MSGVVLVYTLFGDAESARNICRMLVKEKLAACANVLGQAVSIYEWQSKIEENAEVPVILKTRSDLRERLMTRLAVLHPYDVPAILSWDAEVVHSPYGAWLHDQTVL